MGAGVLFIITERKENWRSDERGGFAEGIFEITFPRPMERAEIMTMDNEPRRTSIGLDDVFRLWAGVI